VHPAGLARYRQQGVVGVGGRVGRGARCHAAVLPPPPAERDYPLAKGGNNKVPRKTYERCWLGAPWRPAVPRSQGHPKGGREKKNDESDVHLPQRKKKSSHLLYFYFYFYFYFFDFFKGVFWAFRNKGSSKTREQKPRKSPSRLITKNVAFFPPFFFLLPRLFCSIFFDRVFGRFVTRGVQKRHKKKSRENLLSLLTSLFFLSFHGAP
jgi:hypothetical protein